MFRILLAGILGGIAMYVWTSIAHVATPLGETGIRSLPNEAAVMNLLSSSIGDHHGLYIFPNSMSGKSAGPKEGPMGFLVYRPHVIYSLNPRNLVVEFATELVEAIIAALLLSFAALSGYLSRVGFVTLLGVAAAITTNISYWNWYGFSAHYTAANSFIEVVGYLAAGLMIAWVLPARAAA